MSTKIYFDLDGTVYDFYSTENWLEKLTNEETGLYSYDKILFDKVEFYKTITELLAKGVKFGVITWLSMTASPEYEEITTIEKKEWCKKYLPFIETFVAQSYGTPKQQAIKNRTKNDILIDDNLEVCKMWENHKNRKYYQIKNNNVVEILKEILANME